jgi:HK97 family phage prohead protease
MDLERKVLPLTDVATQDAGSGSFTGYGSVFGELDAQGDIVVRGAYADTLPRFIARGFIAWGHDWTQPVATIREAKEDERGLFLAADFHSDDVSQRARRITAERLARGKFMGLSIGYSTLADEQTEAGRLLKKVELFETSLVTVPALASAGVTTAKSADAKAAIGRHKTATDDGAWDGPANEARLKNDAGAATYRKAFAWVDPEADAATKAAYRFIHHFVSADGTVGAASTKACSTGIGVLNGGRGGTTIPAADRQGVYTHLAGHLRDAGMEPPALKALADLEAKHMDDAPEGSYEALAGNIADAYAAQYGGMAYPVATFPGHAVLCVMAPPGPMGMAVPCDMAYVDVPYALNADGSVTLGTPAEVEEQTRYVPVGGKSLLVPLRAWLTAKAGQPQLSTQRRERLTALRATLNDLGAELDALLEETTPRDREKFARWCEGQRIRARRLGVAV